MRDSCLLLRQGGDADPTERRVRLAIAVAEAELSAASAGTGRVRSALCIFIRDHCHHVRWRVPAL
jgi:hypothetical protein